MTPNQTNHQAEASWLREPEPVDLEHREDIEAETGDMKRDREIDDL